MAVPRTKVGAVAKPSEQVGESFSMDQMRTDAAALKAKDAATSVPALPPPSAEDAVNAAKVNAVTEADQATLSAMIAAFATLKAGDDFSVGFLRKWHLLL